MSFVSRRLALAVVVATALMAFLAIGQAGIAWAGVYDVTTQQDESDGACDATGTGCSLREAVDAAELDPGSTVNVPAGTYVLTLGQIYVDEDMTIAGAGARDTIVDGNHSNRVFKIEGAAVTMSGLTVTNGYKSSKWSAEGGGIKVEWGQLTLNHVAVVGNTVVSHCGEATGGGIYVEGFLKALDGLEELPPSLIVNESLVANNTAGGQPEEESLSTDGSSGPGYGGGILSDGSAIQLTNVTVSDNTAIGTLGPVTASGSNEGSYAGGIGVTGRSQFQVEPVVGPSVSLLNVTVSNNEADYGGGVGADSYTNVTFKNTIVANNSGIGPVPSAVNGYENCWFAEGEKGGDATATSDGHNLENDPEGQCNFNGVGDQKGVDPKLGALQNNTGQTDTRELLEGSPALDTADNSGCPGTDQRDVTRPQKDVCDIGAYEKIYTPPAPVTPAGAVAAAVTKAAATAKISGPRGCVRKSATIRVRGKGISSVTYSLDGKRVKRAKGNSTSVTVRSLKSGAHRVTARITFTSATAAKPVTKRFSIVRCAKAKPKFTG